MFFRMGEDGGACVKLKEELKKIIDNKLVYPVFQPIVSLSSGEILGYEGLSRLSDTDVIKDTETLFQLAGLYAEIWELEQLCRKKILKGWSEFKEKKDGTKLFMNVDPLVISDKSFRDGFTKEYLEKQGLSTKDVVIEITERNTANNMHDFREAVRHYENQGYVIAIDDVGSCYSGLNLICDIKPGYLKLDMGIIGGIEKDGMKLAMVKSLVQFSKLTGVNLIAEGIEEKKILRLLLEMGVQYGQGFFLGKPEKKPENVLKEAKEIIRTHSEQMALSSDVEYGAVILRISPMKAFRAYERKYGDKKADKIAMQLEQSAKESICSDEYERRLQSAEVIALVRKERCNSFCIEIRNRFSMEIKKYYSEQEYEKGFMKGYNKRGEQKDYPIIEVDCEVII